jgi:cell division protein FtsW (lipid II flippase)
MRGWVLLEAGLLLAVAAVCAIGASWAVDGTIAASTLRLGVDATRDVAAVEVSGRSAALWFAGGATLLAAVRVATGLTRKGRDLPAPMLLPAAMAAAALGLIVQLGYGNPFNPDKWKGPPFAQGIFVASCVASAILALPGDLGAQLSRARGPLAGLALVLLVALGLVGTGPGSSDAHVNLFGVQPMEAVKLAAVLVLADFLARRAPELRYQRQRAGFLRIPRLPLLLPALAALIATWAFLFALKDLGPTLILGAVFLGLFGIVTRSPGWVSLAVGVIVAIVGLLAWNPELAPSSMVETRLRMWVDPWFNGVRNGDQIALARWALAAGGLGGTGIGAALPYGLPAGHTDLAFVHLVEELGVLGGWAYLACIAAIVANGMYLAVHNRTPERQLMAAALVLLLVAQLSVILGGSLGLMPLTGVVVPFLSYGKTSAAAFLGLVALLSRLADDGARRADTEVLRELAAGNRGALVVLLGCVAALGATTAVLALYDRDATSLRSVVTTLGDGTPSLRHDPRLAAIAAQVRRGTIADRNGESLAESPTAGARVTPLGDAFGTVLGPTHAGMLRPKWSLERQHDPHLRGWPDRADSPAMWLGALDGHDALVLAVPSAAQEDPSERARAEAAHRARGGDGVVRRVALAAPDYGALLPLARMSLATRGEAVKALADDVPSRSLAVTLDARVQADVARAARAAAAKSKVGAAAIVVMDAQSGHVLARAQWPDFDPSGTAWVKQREAHDPKFMGIYGAWSDKTGAHGVWQAGSVFKILSATAAVRAGLVPVPTDPASCPTSSEPRFACTDVRDGKTALMRDGWSRPIHDFGDGGARGQVDLVEAITRSSNVWFGQLALALGPDAYRKLREDGVEFGNPDLLDEKDGPYTGLGEAGSRRLAQTGFGQGAGSWNVTQAARLVASVANGGTYVRCASDMRLDGACTSTRIIPDGASLAPILAGMRGVMERGTGARLPRIPGVRLYGKTGTADAPGTRDEAPWGIRARSVTSPHSWFVAIAEPDDAPSCADGAGRYVVAAVVPHGGFGAAAAGPLALEAVRSLRTNGYLGAVTTSAGAGDATP